MWPFQSREGNKKWIVGSERTISGPPRCLLGLSQSEADIIHRLASSQHSGGTSMLILRLMLIIAASGLAGWFTPRCMLAWTCTYENTPKSFSNPSSVRMNDGIGSSTKTQVWSVLRQNPENK